MYMAIVMVTFMYSRVLYGYEKDTSEWIAEAGEIPKDKVMWCDSAEPDRIKTWRTAGWRARPVNKEPNSVKAQIDWIKGRRVHIHPSCTDFIKEIEQWKWKYDDVRNMYLDEPVPFFDDAIASLRYGIELFSLLIIFYPSENNLVAIRLTTHLHG